MGGLAASVLALGLVPTAATSAAAAPEEGVHRGDLPSGSRYVVEVPAGWNGKLLLWNLGYIGGPPGGEATSGPGGATREWLLSEGYALAALKPTTNGWAVEDFLEETPDLYAEALDVLGSEPAATIAWGSSMGGQVSAALAERYPGTIDGALPMCASVAGGVGMLNSGLDGAFVFKTLLAPDDDAIELVNVSDERARSAAASAVLEEARGTPEGRARIALAAAVAQIPGWVQQGAERPAADDHEAQLDQQASVFMFSVFSPREPLEARAGGNFSWNTGIDYAEQLRISGNSAQVEALYAAAGLSLEEDLATLAATPRVTADAAAVQYMLRNATPTGRITQPVLTLHESGDTAPVIGQAQAYADAVAAAGRAELLRQTYVDRPGHCSYSPAETVAALDTLAERIDTGTWPDTSADALEARAAALDAASSVDLGAADFADLEVPGFVRAYYPRVDVDLEGTFADGRRYVAHVPADWDGTAAVLGRVTRLDRPEHRWLSERGVAMIGYEYHADWDLGGSRDNATVAHDTLARIAGAVPHTTIATGSSQAGLTTRIIAQQAPEWLDGAAPMCGGGAGAISMWNAKLDTTFALRTLVDPDSPLDITRIGDVRAEGEALDELVSTAVSSPLGQARIALAAALSKIPALDADGEELTELADRVEAYAESMPLAVGASIRAPFEETAGGSFSWNNDVDYREALRDSGRIEEVRAAYAAAGGDLEADLQALHTAERLTADEDAVRYVESLATFDGELAVPVVSLHTTGDPAGPTADDDAYRSVVEHAGRGEMLRNTFVKARGHCTFTTAEVVTALDLLLDRVETGEYGPAAPDALDARAADLAAATTLELGRSRFVQPEPQVPARPWDARHWGSHDPAAGVPAGPTLTLPLGEVRPGERLSVELTGFTTGGSYELWLAADDALLGAVTVDGDGEGSVEVAIAEGQAAGDYRLEARSPAGTVVATAPMTVLTAADGPTPPVPGDGDTPAGAGDGTSPPDASGPDGAEPADRLPSTGATPLAAGAVATLLAAAGALLAGRRRSARR